MLEYEKKKTEEALKQLRENDGQKDQMRKRFVRELMRRQEVNGTFEDSTGKRQKQHILQTAYYMIHELYKILYHVMVLHYACIYVLFVLS